MVTEERLERYFEEAKKHIQKIKAAQEILQNVMPLDAKSLMGLDEREQDKLDILIFRFAKLQDLLGRKIFRTILSYSGYETDIPFVEILSELEREGLIEVERWMALRDARNAIAHEYPNEEAQIVDELNFIYDEVGYLVELTSRLEEYFYAIKSKRAARD